MATRTTHVALLRGINVGGKNKLPMKELVALFEQAGCSDVRHYIQSGNIVFAATSTLAQRTPETVSKAITNAFGFDAPVIVRSGDALRRVATSNPLLADGAEVASLHVGFLADEPSAKGLASLDPNRSPPDTFVIGGQEIYLSCPNGMARTKFTNAYFDSKLGTVTTFRNWKTVLRLVEMARAV